jgi:hypothetical protein
LPTVDARITSDGRLGTERVGLVMPTSLCSTEIARLAAERVGAETSGVGRPLSRCVALLHTEGCGFGGDDAAQTLLRTYLGYAQHPNVAAAVMLEHGCEKVPNDTVRNHFRKNGADLSRFGWVSVQLDGGIDGAVRRVAEYFSTAPLTRVERSRRIPVSALCFGIMTSGTLDAGMAELGCVILRRVVASGGTVLIPRTEGLLRTDAARRILGDRPPTASLLAGEVPAVPGLHVVETETPDWAENLSALGSAGAHAVVGLVDAQSRSGHPLVPVFQFVSACARSRVPEAEFDGFLSGPMDELILWQRIAKGLSGEVPPACRRMALEHFQLSRGLLGVST